MTGRISRSYISNEIFSVLCRPCSFNGLSSSKKTVLQFHKFIGLGFFFFARFFFFFQGLLFLANYRLQDTQMLIREVDVLPHVQSQHLDPVLELCCTKFPVETAKLKICIKFCRLIICLLPLSVFSTDLSPIKG